MTDSLREKVARAIRLSTPFDSNRIERSLECADATLAAVREHLGNSDTVRLAIDTYVLNAYGMNAEPMKAALLAALGDIK